jgi:hypothetical protein
LQLLDDGLGRFVHDVAVGRSIGCGLGHFLSTS